MATAALALLDAQISSATADSGIIDRLALSLERSSGACSLSKSSCQLSPMPFAGAECPASTSVFCPDEQPVCCGTPGDYYCAETPDNC